MKRFLSLLLILTVLTGCTKGSPRDSFRAESNAAGEPFTAYPELVTYTVAHLGGANNSNMPEGDTYEDNAYTRYLKKTLNIQNTNVFEATETPYFNQIEMMISSKQIPDVLIVNDYNTLKYLYEHDMIADLTDAYEHCASDRIKEIYRSYGDDILDNVTYDGKLYAMPETNIDDGPNLFWVRQDWLDTLQLDAPKTLDDVEKIVRAFREKNMGEGETTGLMVDTTLTGGTAYASAYLLDLYFASYNSYPRQWLMKDGEVVYGSVDARAKKALAHIHDLYQEGIIDQKFLFRTTDDIQAEIANGHCGAFFGPWWVPNNPLAHAREANPAANWKPYLIATGNKGETNYHAINPSTKYVVVRKGFEHPELIFKVISVLFDQARYSDFEQTDINDYYRLNVDPTARPISINVDYNNALHRSHIHIETLLKGRTPKNLSSLDLAYERACRDYLEGKEENKTQNWAAYVSRIEALSLLENEQIKRVRPCFFGTTATMQTSWYALEEMEKDTYLKIIIGEKDVDAFDAFVAQWYQEGGETITKEVSAIVQEQD